MEQRKKSKKRIMMFSDWYSPGYKAGGPIQSCVNLVHTMSHIFDFFILTSDRDLGDNAPYGNIECNSWTIGDRGEHIFYLEKRELSIRKIEQLIKQINPEIVYFNSMFSLRYTILPRIVLRKMKFDGKIVLAPRGMLHAGALGLKSQKKKLFLSAFRILGLNKRIFFHATDVQEIEDIKGAFPNACVFLAENIPHLNKSKSVQIRKNPGDVKMVYVSRIHPKKNLIYILEVLKGFDNSGSIELDIYGNIEDEEYKRKADLIITTLPSNVIVSFKGALPNSLVFEVLSKYHVFVLPTLGENFGHAIFEALTSGLPILISDNTPWRDLEKIKAGWDISLNHPELFRKTITTLIDMDQSAFNEWTNGAYQLSKEYVENADYEYKYSSLFS